MIKDDGRVLLRRLIDLDEIKRLKARFFRTIDTKDWSGLRELLTDDVVMDTTSSGGDVVTGAEDCVGSLRESIGEGVTVHHGHAPEIDLTSPWTAAGVWAMTDVMRWSDGREVHGYGHYHETYEKVDGAWRIKRLTLTRLRMDVTSP